MVPQRRGDPRVHQQGRVLPPNGEQRPAAEVWKYPRTFDTVDG